MIKVGDVYVMPLLGAIEVVGVADGEVQVKWRLGSMSLTPEQAEEMLRTSVRVRRAEPQADEPEETTWSNDPI